MLEPSPKTSLDLFDTELIQENSGPPMIEAVVHHAAPDPNERPSKKKKQVLFWIAIGWLALVVFLSVFASFLPFVKPYDKIYADAFKTGPELSHWFGTDAIGRDVFSRTVYGARLSLMIGGASIFFGLLIGGGVGLIVGYFKGKLDRVVSVGVDIMLAFPALILALAITAFLGRGAIYVILALSILSIPPLIRIVRATTMVYAGREFVLAATSLGAKKRRIITREVLPNVVPSMLSFALTGLAVLIIAEGALAFLGQSVPDPQPTWGKIISDGQQDLRTAWWISLLPSFVLFLTVLAINIIGDTLSKRFDIREGAL